jgi:hypothetical protein
LSTSVATTASTCSVAADITVHKAAIFNARTMLIRSNWDRPWPDRATVQLQIEGVVIGTRSSYLIFKANLGLSSTREREGDATTVVSRRDCRAPIIIIALIEPVVCCAVTSDARIIFYRRHPSKELIILCAFLDDNWSFDLCESRRHGFRKLSLDGEPTRASVFEAHVSDFGAIFSLMEN